jgi:hypothetical protein
VRTASGPRCTGLLALLLALTLIADASPEGRAQHPTRAAVGAPRASRGWPVAPITDLRVPSDIAPTSSPRLASRVSGGVEF